MENKLFYIRGSKTNPEGVKKALLEKYPNICNQSLVVWTQEDMLIYVDGDDCCSCCYDDSTVGRTLIKYGEEIVPLVNATKASTEANIFENAKFGDKFLTRGRRTAIYIKPSNHSDLFKHYLIIEGDDFLTGYFNDGRQTENDKTINDIISRSEDWELWRDAHFEFERLGAMYNYSDCDVVWRKVEENIKNGVNVPPSLVQRFEGKRNVSYEENMTKLIDYEICRQIREDFGHMLGNLEK